MPPFIAWFAAVALLTIAPFGMSQAALSQTPAASSAPADSAAALVSRARGLFELSKYKDAIALLDRALALDPNQPRALVLRGDAKSSLGDDAGALLDYNQAIHLAPEYAYAYATRCDTRRSLDDLAAALTDCNRAIELDSELGVAYRFRGDVYYGLSDYPASIQNYTHAIALTGDDVSAYTSRCRSYRALKAVTLALADCNAAVKLDRDYGRGHFWLGVIAVDQARWTDAVSSLNTTLHLDPETTGAFYYRALALHKLDKNELALQDANAYIKLSPTDGDGLRLRGEIFSASHNSTAAAADYKQAIALYQQQGYAAAASEVRTLLTQLQAKP
jgi:tetratricopeptide (TPR) repeat protein